MEPQNPPRPRLFSGGQLLVAAMFGLPLAVAVLAKWHDPEAERYYRELRKSTERKAFRPTQIRLCNDWLWPERTLDP